MVNIQDPFLVFGMEFFFPGRSSDGVIDFVMQKKWGVNGQSVRQPSFPQGINLIRQIFLDKKLENQRCVDGDHWVDSCRLRSSRISRMVEVESFLGRPYLDRKST